MKTEGAPAQSRDGNSKRLRHMFRRFRQMVCGSRNSLTPRGSESDQFARNLMDDAARQLAPKLNVPESELGQALWNCREGKPPGETLIAPIRVECAITKIASNQICLCVQMLCQQDGRSVITTLKRECAWDNLPREIRSEFIRTGQMELHYILCEFTKNNPPKQ